MNHKYLGVDHKSNNIYRRMTTRTIKRWYYIDFNGKTVFTIMHNFLNRGLEPVALFKRSESFNCFYSVLSDYFLFIKKPLCVLFTYYNLFLSINNI